MLFRSNCSYFITGIGADIQNEAQSSTTCTTNTYETEKGQAASTTGNITGVYDMSGGSLEYVMGVYNNTIGSSGFSQLVTSKYLDNYTGSISSPICNGNSCYGHTTNETPGWYNDAWFFVNETEPWIHRGGCYWLEERTGVFNIAHYNGNALSNASMRIIIS